MKDMDTLLKSTGQSFSEEGGQKDLMQQPRQLPATMIGHRPLAVSLPRLHSERNRVPLSSCGQVACAGGALQRPAVTRGLRQSRLIAHFRHCQAESDPDLGDDAVAAAYTRTPPELVAEVQLCKWLGLSPARRQLKSAKVPRAVAVASWSPNWEGC